MPPPLQSRGQTKGVEGVPPLPEEAALRLLAGPGEVDDDQWRSLKGEPSGEEPLAKVENGPEIGPVALTVPRLSELRAPDDKAASAPPPLIPPLGKPAPPPPIDRKSVV